MMARVMLLLVDDEEDDMIMVETALMKRVIVLHCRGRGRGSEDSAR